ncbi:putative Tudor domain, survival motor neuron [Dioscorea sansibarensis]
MQGGEDLSIHELASNLSTYKDQLHEVRKLLADDARNTEYVDMEKELNEVISLTEELLATAKQSEIAGLVDELDADASPVEGVVDGKSLSKLETDQDDRFPVGTKVQAVWSEDGEWYDATIEAFTSNGYFVSYDEWGNKEEVDPANVRPIKEEAVNALLEAEREAEATRQAIKRKIAQAAVSDFQARTLPAKLRIDPNDPDDVVLCLK